MTEDVPTGTDDGTNCRVEVLVLGAIVLALIAVVPLTAAGSHVGAPGGAAAAPGPVTGQADAAAQPTICGRSVDPLVGTYNENVDAVPGIVRDRVRDTRIHGVVNGPGGGEYAFVTDPGGRIETYSEGAPDDPTLRMVTDCESLGAVADADAPGDAFRREYRNGGIRFVGVGPVEWAAVTWLDFAVTAGEVISRVTPLGIQTGITVAALFPLAVLVVLLVLGYVGYRRVSIARHRRARARATTADAGGGEEASGGDGQEEE